MNFFTRSSILSLLFILLLPVCNAQNDPPSVSRSKNKVIISGKIYYIHTTQKGETIYSISKAYNIGQKELFTENPDLAYGLKEGMNLRIPERPLPVVDQILGDTTLFIFHIVTEGQTLYSISKMYNVSVEEITEANPEVKYSNIQLKQVLRIPKKEPVQAQTNALKTPAEEKFSYHVVQKGETLFSLSRHYDLKKDDIIRWNGGDNWEGLKAGDTLRIPNSRNLEPIADTLTQVLPVKDTTSVLTFTLNDSCNCDSIRMYNYLNELRIALVLPLNVDDFLLETQDTTLSVDDAGQKFKNTAAPFDEKDMLDQNWIEFYEGFMLALKHSKDSAINVNLKIFDTGNILHPIYLQVSDIAEFHPNLIVCPLADSSFQSLVNIARDSKIPLISPVYPASKLDISRGVISLAPSWLQTVEKVSYWLADDPYSNLIVVHSADSSSGLAISLLKNILPPTMIMKEAIHNDTAVADFDLSLSANVPNKILILSDKEEYVTEIIRGLVLSSRTFDINLIGFSSWAKFRSISIEDLHNLNLSFITPYRIDFNSNKVHKFLQTFQNIYGYYPYRSGSLGFNYGMLGFDTFDLGMNAIKTYGSQATCCLNGQLFQYVMGPYIFRYYGNQNVLQKSNWMIVNYNRSLDVNVQDLTNDHSEIPQSLGTQP